MFDWSLHMPLMLERSNDRVQCRLQLQKGSATPFGNSSMGSAGWLDVTLRRSSVTFSRCPQSPKSLSSEPHLESFSWGGAGWLHVTLQRSCVTFARCPQSPRSLAVSHQSPLHTEVLGRSSSFAVLKAHSMHASICMD